MSETPVAPVFSPHSLAQNAEAPKDPTTVFDGTVFNGIAHTEYAMERKYDGIRILAHITDDAVHFYTRTATDKTGFLPYIEMALLDTFPANTWLDGEIVALNADGTQNWGGAQSVLGSGKAKAARMSGSVSYVIFDVLMYNGLDIRALPLTGRRQALDSHLTEPWIDQGRTLLVPSPWDEPSRERYEEYLAQGYEGAMLKRKNGKYYSSKRGYGWTKLKATDEADVIVTGYQEGKDSFSGLVGAIIFGQYDSQGVLRDRGKCSGMDMKIRKEITDNQDLYMGQPFSVAYMGIMPSGALRHPQWKRWRTDKPAEDCIWTAS